MRNVRRKLSIVIVGVALLLVIVGSASSAQAASGHFISGVPLYGQQHNLSCEYASARMVTAYWGDEISESTFMNAIGTAANPHLGYRGNIDGPAGGITDYGIYAEPIANYLSTQGFKTSVFYNDAIELRQEIDSGHPVIVWLTYGLSVEPRYRMILDGQPASLVPEEHAVVVTGYDANYVYVNGPADAVRTRFTWADFTRSWNYFDDMALSIWR